MIANSCSINPITNSSYYETSASTNPDLSSANQLNTTTGDPNILEAKQEPVSALNESLKHENDDQTNARLKLKRKQSEISKAKSNEESDDELEHNFQEKKLETVYNSNVQQYQYNTGSKNEPSLATSILESITYNPYKSSLYTNEPASYQMQPQYSWMKDGRHSNAAAFNLPTTLGINTAMPMQQASMSTNSTSPLKYAQNGHYYASAHKSSSNDLANSTISSSGSGSSPSSTSLSNPNDSLSTPTGKTSNLVLI